MSLELVLAETNTLLKQLLEKIGNDGTATVTEAAPEPEKVVTTKKTKVKETVAVDPEPTEPTTPEKPVTLNYEEASKVITFFVAKVGTPRVREIFTKFGISKLPEAKPEQYTVIVDACWEAFGDEVK